MIVAVLLAVTLVAGMVGTGARFDRLATPAVETIAGAHHFRLAGHTTATWTKARLAPLPDPEPSGDDDLDALAALALAASLAVIVRMADRLPQGHPDRQALADATGPLRAALYGRERIAA